MNLVISIIWMLSSLIHQSEVDSKTIIFYGDSITAGYGVGIEFAFPKLIESQLDKNGLAAEVINAGLSGETSAGGLTRIDWILNRKFDVFVLELGANDGLRGLPVEETSKNLQSIIDKVKAKYPETLIILAGMMVPPNMGPEYSRAFEEIYPKLAKSNELGLIPFLLKDVAGIEELNQPDGIHPNVQGHKIIAHNLYPYFKKLY
ncbi:MAG: arylesterase [Bacteroidetes bacterium]|nr:MAG: arylesterase [Bacteroidota bacterium]